MSANKICLYLVRALAAGHLHVLGKRIVGRQNAAVPKDVLSGPVLFIGSFLAKAQRKGIDAEHGASLDLCMRRFLVLYRLLTVVV